MNRPAPTSVGANTLCTTLVIACTTKCGGERLAAQCTDLQIICCIIFRGFMAVQPIHALHSISGCVALAAGKTEMVFVGGAFGPKEAYKDALHTNCGDLKRLNLCTARAQCMDPHRPLFQQS